MAIAVEADALRVQRAHHRFPDIVVEAAQRQFTAADDIDLGAEGTARLREVAAPLSKAVLPAFAVEGVFAPRSPRASPSCSPSRSRPARSRRAGNCRRR